MAFAVRGGVGRGRPQPFQFLVEPRHGQRAAGHVEAGDQLADLGLHHVKTSAGEQGRNGFPHHEKLFILGAAQPVEDHGDSIRCAVRLFGEDAVDEDAGKLFGGRQGMASDSGLTVDAQSQVHCAGRHREQWQVRPGHGAAVECDPEGAGGVVGLSGHPFDIVEAVPFLGRRASAPEHGEVACDSAPFGRVFWCGACDVVGHYKVAGVDALRAQLPGGQTEVHHVTGVIAGDQQDTRVPVCGAGDRCGLGRGRRGEDVADDGAVGESGSDHAAERG